MIDDKDRIALIKYRMEQAIDTIDVVDFLINSDKLTVAVNRIYYGLFYSVTALAINNGFETSKHAQLIGWFNKEFVATKKTDVKFGSLQSTVRRLICILVYWYISTLVLSRQLISHLSVFCLNPNPWSLIPNPFCPFHFHLK